ncbi:MAG: alpha/beta fold hydrolase [Cyclobacteriaceae bacterium]
MRIVHGILVCSFIVFIGSTLRAQDATKRRQYLEDILRINTPQVFKGNTRRVTAQDSTWKDWLQRTGELPPDFSKMRSIPFLPDPLSLHKNGKDQSVRTKNDWQEKRAWIKEQYAYWVSGTAPPAPENLEVTILSEKNESGTLIRVVELRFGPDNRARMTVELMIPEGDGPFPVFMTQWDHRDYAQIALRRGYMACVYAAADSKDDTELYQVLYPDFDWSMLLRRAWGASRVVDFLTTQKNVNKHQIAIMGLSRNGKQSLWAAAFDERIAAVVDCSSGTGGIAPWRYGDPQYASETLDLVTAYNGHWFHPRLNFFFGREDKLPVDQNLLISLIAPRILLHHYAIVERGLNPWANEQCFQSVKSVYRLLGAEENANLYTRYGEHFVNARDVEKCIDYLDNRFKRKTIPWDSPLYFNDYSYSAWVKNHASDSLASRKMEPIRMEKKYRDIRSWEIRKKGIIENLQWLLGEEPSGAKPAKIGFVRDGDWIDNITGRPRVTNAIAQQIGPSFPVTNAMGDFLRGMLYHPVDKDGNKVVRSNGKMPVVIFLHQYAHSTGFAFGYDVFYRNGNARLFQALLDQGFAVLALDLFGFGSRIEEAQYFYQRYPQWSKMGRMITDVKYSVDALQSFDFIDDENIFLLGNTLGGNLALMSAALDDRVAGVAVLSAFSPWRASKDQYESIRINSHSHGLMPRLGLYANRAAEVPVDYPEIISAIAPRPLLVIAPTLDRHADFPAVEKTMEQVSSIYDLYQRRASLRFDTPPEINRMTESMYGDVVGFFKEVLGKREIGK